jgi:hypothetical protein
MNRAAGVAVVVVSSAIGDEAVNLRELALRSLPVIEMRFCGLSTKLGDGGTTCDKTPRCADRSMWELLLLPPRIQ